MLSFRKVIRNRPSENARRLKRRPTKRRKRKKRNGKPRRKSARRRKSERKPRKSLAKRQRRRRRRSTTSWSGSTSVPRRQRMLHSGRKFERRPRRFWRASPEKTWTTRQNSFLLWSQTTLLTLKLRVAKDCRLTSARRRSSNKRFLASRALAARNENVLHRNQWKLSVPKIQLFNTLASDLKETVWDVKRALLELLLWRNRPRKLLERNPRRTRNCWTESTRWSSTRKVHPR